MSIHRIAIVLVLSAWCLFGQEPATGRKPLDRVIGAVTSVDKPAHRVTVKEDKTGDEYTVDLGNAKTLLKVQPGAKDLSGAARITADDLQAGDRIQIGGSKTEGEAHAFSARSVILMSGRELQQAKEAEAAAWQHSTPGIVTSVDATSGKLSAQVRTPEGMKPMQIDVSKAELTRYSPETPKTPIRAQLTDIQPSDHILFIGEKSADGSSASATKLYSGAFRTINGTVLSVSPDGKAISVRNLASKQPVQIALDDQSSVKHLPPMLAMGLARRLNPDYKPMQAGAATAAHGGDHSGPGASGQGEGRPGADAGNRMPPPVPGGDANAQSGGPGNPGMRRGGNGDISQLIERLPKVSVSELKPGDAVVVAGVATGKDGSQLLATSVIAGVEPILQSAPRRQGGEALGGDWGLGEMAIPQ